MQITLEQLVATKANVEAQRNSSLQLATQAEGALLVLDQLIAVMKMKDPVTTDKAGVDVLGVPNVSPR